MKISKISYNQVNINNIQRIKKTTFQDNKIQYSSNVTTPINSYKGVDLVSFKSGNFEQTINDNYFKLPKGCTPDDFQIKAAQSLYNGNHVITEAPTGIGKTAIGCYVISKNLADNKKTIYTTPLKALSNQKLSEFQKIYGQENVGIMTGDRRLNPNAPIIVMTTEVYRNMALANMYENNNPIMKDVGTVIFDEMHFMDDEDRGKIWEESVMYTPENIQMLGLSATIGNSKDLNNWINDIKNKKSDLISVGEEARPVPLLFENFETSSYIDEEKRIKNANKKGKSVNFPDKMKRPELSDYKNVLNVLKKEGRLPAIFFVFSKKFSREILDYLQLEGPDLTTRDEKKEISKIIEEYNQKNYLGTDLNIRALEKGYAVHNAGILPEQKELIEELFQKKLVKVVIATETLAAGINMPAKTVLLSRPYKPTSNLEGMKISRNEAVLTPNEFKQMSGRAGRRGIDEKGYVYTMLANKDSELEFNELKNSECNPIRSKYSPDYSFLSGYYKYNPYEEELKYIFEKSFNAFSNDDKIRKQNISNLMDLAQKRTNVLTDRGFLTNNEGFIHPSKKGLMASAIKGYDTLSLIETIENGDLKGISPEGLAAFAGLVANPADYKDTVIYPGEKFNNIFAQNTNSIFKVYDYLQKSISEILEQFGYKFEDFNNLQEMLDFADNITKPDKSFYDIKMELYIIDSQIKKLKTINSPRKNISPEDVYKVLKQEHTISSATLENTIEKVEHYKKKNNIKDFEAYINSLKEKIESLKSSNNNKKAQKRNEREIEDLTKEIDTAIVMSYLDNNLYNVIGENYKFTKQHSLKKLETEYSALNDEYLRLTQKDKLTGQIKGMMGIENYAVKNNFDMEDEQNQDILPNSLNQFLKNTESVNLTEQANLLETHMPEYGLSSPTMLYHWARMNKINPDGISNWKIFLKLFSNDNDEGSVYKKITQTADLLSQIKEIAFVGIKESQDPYERKYYEDLKNTAIEAKKLIINDPVHL